MKIIDFNEFKKLDLKQALIIDIRDAVSFSYGHIPGAKNIEVSELKNFLGKQPSDIAIVVFTKNGVLSKEPENILNQSGFVVYILKDGYMGWVEKHLQEVDVEDYLERVELSLRKKFHKQLFSKFAKAINEYDLIQPNDKIAVCISGGKDSMLMAKLFQELKRHNKFPFELKFIVMDPGYNEANRKLIETNCKLLNIPAEIFETEIFDNVFNVEKSPCYLCARMRRGHLYNKAKELGCNKIALGHHYDDVIETILMGMLYGAQIQTMMPKLHSTNFEGMELIRPLYLIREDDIKHWRDYNDLHFLECACKFTEQSANEQACDTSNLSSKRLKVKNLIKQIKCEDPQIEGNIFKSVENVNLSTVIAYKDKQGERHHFLSNYDN